MTPHSEPNMQPQSDGALSGVKDQVADLARDAASQGKRHAESAYREAASVTADTSDALEKAAAELEDSGHETLSDAATALSNHVRSLSSYLEDRRLEDLISDGRRLAQRNPALFVAGGVALGFALTRFLKASAPEGSGSTRDMS